jgi:hypothetical protein
MVVMNLIDYSRLSICICKVVGEPQLQFGVSVERVCKQSCPQNNVRVPKHSPSGGKYGGVGHHDVVSILHCCRIGKEGLKSFESWNVESGRGER